MVNCSASSATARPDHTGNISINRQGQVRTSPRLLGGLEPGGGAAGADAGVSAPRRAPGCCMRPPPRAAPAVWDTTLLARYMGDADAGGEEASSKPPRARGTGAVKLSAGCWCSWACSRAAGSGMPTAVSPTPATASWGSDVCSPAGAGWRTTSTFAQWHAWHITCCTQDTLPLPLGGYNLHCAWTPSTHLLLPLRSVPSHHPRTVHSAPQTFARQSRRQRGQGVPG